MHRQFQAPISKTAFFVLKSEYGYCMRETFFKQKVGKSVHADIARTSGTNQPLKRMDISKMLLVLFIMFCRAGSISLEPPPKATLELISALLASRTIGEGKDLLVIASPKLVEPARYRQ